MGQKINSAAKASKNMFSKLRIENLPFDMVKVRDSFSSHADGIWDVNVAQFDPSLFGILQVRKCLTLAHSSFPAFSQEPHPQIRPRRSGRWRAAVWLRPMLGTAGL
jgi:hypothetical protein